MVLSTFYSKYATGVTKSSQLYFKSYLHIYWQGVHCIDMLKLLLLVIICMSVLQARILCAPFFYVGFADFWLADQLNSLASALLDFQYLICFYITNGNWMEAGGKVWCLPCKVIRQKKSYLDKWCSKCVKPLK